MPVLYVAVAIMHNDDCRTSARGQVLVLNQQVLALRISVARSVIRRSVNGVVVSTILRSSTMEILPTSMSSGSAVA